MRRGFGGVLRWTGFSFLALGVLASVPILLEGMTGLVGEGERLRAESPDRIWLRLVVVASLWAAAALGWVLARFGTALREPNARPRLSVARLLSEVLLLLGGIGLAVGVLTAISPRAEGYEPAGEYRLFLKVAVATGLGLLILGWAVRRWWVRPKESSAPSGVRSTSS